MATAIERQDRQARVAELVAGGATVAECARILGVTRPTVYRDLRAIRSRSLDRVMLDEEAEAAAIDQELRELESLFRSARRVLEEKTEPGTREYAAVLASLVRVKNLKLHAAAELGVYRKAVQRHMVLPGDELAGLEGSQLDEFIANLDEVEQRLNRATRRKAGK